MCDLLRDDEELSSRIYSQLHSSCKSVGSSILKSIGGKIFKDRERKEVFEEVDKF